MYELFIDVFQEYETRSIQYNETESRVISISIEKKDLCEIP